ncbi:MAG TPA: hypothetical protein VGQ47_01645 [Candidatus Limnocylindrales bacterium]|jgi:hypothetical protein|nr:hypothetical protein [Candidatus Limnocylindrales bacterium]
MNGFIVESSNKPGEIARVTEALSAKGINITSCACVGYGERGAMGVLTNDEQGTRSAFDDAGISYREVELVSFAIPDRPGTLAEASRRLADAGVNIELLLPTGMSGSDVSIAAGVDNAAAARDALKEFATVRA